MDLERASKFKEVFTGAREQNIEAFFDRFDLWCAKNGHTDEYKVENFVFCIDGPAYTVYKSLAKSVRTDYPELKRFLITCYGPTRLPAEDEFEKNYWDSPLEKECHPRHFLSFSINFIFRAILGILGNNVIFRFSVLLGCPLYQPRCSYHFNAICS